MPKLDVNVPHSPVVLKQFEKRASNVQLRVADAITAFAGSMHFVYIHVAVVRGLDARVREEPVADADARRVARGHLLVDVRHDRPEPQRRVPAGQGRPRLRGRGGAAEGEHRPHPRRSTNSLSRCTRSCWDRRSARRRVTTPRTRRSNTNGEARDRDADHAVEPVVVAGHDDDDHRHDRVRERDPAPPARSTRRRCRRR